MQRGNPFARKVLLTSLLLLFWIVITASFSFVNIILGIVCSCLTMVIAWLVLGRRLIEGITLPVLVRFPLFAVALIWEIIKANIDVALIVINPQLPISPRIVQFKTRLKGDLERTIFANSITLTPGTVTIDVQDDIFYVHCLATHHQRGLLQGRDRMVAWLFGQKLGEQEHAGESVT